MGAFAARNDNMLQRAMRERWPVSDAQRAAIAQRMVAIACEGSDKEAVNATRVLMEADRLELQALQVLINAKAVSLQQEKAEREDDGRISITDTDLADGLHRIAASAPEAETGADTNGQPNADGQTFRLPVARNEVA